MTTDGDGDAPGGTMPPSGLLPGGTARALFLRRQRAGALPNAGATHVPQVRGESVLPEALCERLRGADIPATSIWLAWEVARCAAAASAEERRAVALLTIALLTAMDAGSSYLRLLAAPPISAMMPPLPGAGSESSEEVPWADA